MKYLFLDLENTVIDSWDNPIILNNIEVHKKIKELKPDICGVFSFAIWNDEDKNNFIKNIMPDLNENFKIKINIDFIFTIPEIQKFVLQNDKMEVRDFINYFGKELSFIQFCKNYFDEGQIYFIDDTVRNLLISSDDVIIQFINPILKKKNLLRLNHNSHIV